MVCRVHAGPAGIGRQGPSQHGVLPAPWQEGMQGRAPASRGITRQPGGAAMTAAVCAGRQQLAWRRWLLLCSSRCCCGCWLPLLLSRAAAAMLSVCASHQQLWWPRRQLSCAAAVAFVAAGPSVAEWRGCSTLLYPNCTVLTEPHIHVYVRFCSELHVCFSLFA